MDQTLLCVLGLFLLNTLCGSAQDPPTAQLTIQPNWSQIFLGEMITFRCEIVGSEEEHWTHYLRKSYSDQVAMIQNEYIISHPTEADSGEYSCYGATINFLTAWSNPIRLTVTSQKPRLELSADKETIQGSESSTLTCSVNPPSSGWKYLLYKQEKTSERLFTKDDGHHLNGRFHVQQGQYRCRGVRGDPGYYTDYSNSVTINKTLPNQAVVTLQSQWTEIYSGETITLRCEIQDDEINKWKYEWETISSDTFHSESNTIRATVDSDGEYRCRGKHKTDLHSLTAWSDLKHLRVSSKPQPVLTVSPSWLSPGDTVTLTCGVEHPSDGWRFYWFKAVPSTSGTFYSYEQLPGSISGTEESSYIVDGQTHTAGYVCRAGRGRPEFFSEYSQPEFVWSGDFHSSASLTVTPNSVQHFLSDSVVLNCEGNSTRWRVRRFLKENRLMSCSQWGKMSGSTCTLKSSSANDGIYWCESGSGQFSNAVNMTKQSRDIILVSPAHPVMEKNSVSLSCRWKSYYSCSDVFFYWNEKLIQNDTRRELNISSVTKSDEGFYKCRCSGVESSQSWMSVKAASMAENSSFPVIPVVASLICGFVFIFLLLLLYFYRRSKNSGFIRSVGSQTCNQSSAGDHVGDQSAAHESTYASLSGHIDLYDTIQAPRNTATGKSNPGPTEEPLYSEITPATAYGGPSSCVSTNYRNE